MEVPIVEQQRSWRNWHLLSILFSLNHGFATTPLIFATTLLSPDVGYIGSALLYIFTCLGSLFLSVPFVSTCGQQMGLFCGMMLYCLYVGAFAAAASCAQGSGAQWVLFSIGSSLGGLAASVLWTAQGSSLDRHSTAVQGGVAGDRQQATASLASIFASYYLIFEVACKLAASVALSRKVVPWILFTACVGFALFAAIGVLCLRNPEAAAPQQPVVVVSRKAQATGKLLKALSLWRDPSIWLLSFTNLTFGFSAALMNGYVNAAYTKHNLGKDWVGIYGTLTAFVGAVASQIFGQCAKTCGTKAPFVLLGSLCFLMIPVLVLFANLDTWGHSLVILYILQGCGRSVYESTNKGLFADFFPGENAEGAFANSMMQTTLSFAFCFFLSSVLRASSLAIIVATLASLTFPGYLLALRLRQTQKKGDCPTTLESGSEGETEDQEDEEDENTHCSRHSSTGSSSSSTLSSRH